jgi:hypothetical protein
MCTVTVLRNGDTLRVACNRDERRERPLAHPPFITLADGVQVLTPQDPQGRGTWIAASSSGLVFALLNAHSPGAPPAQAPRSRGLVIPALVHALSLEEVAFRVADLPAEQFAPFRLVVADLLHASEFVFEEGEWRAVMHRLAHPLLFTSSSLGDVIVEGPRRLLFEQMFATRASWTPAAQQDAFHAHRWRDRPAVSVHMSRPDACTVSTTTVEVTARQVRMLYKPAHCAAGTPVGLVIDRRDVTAAPRTCRQYARV